VSLSVARRGQVDDIAALLSAMGHSVSSVEIDYGWAALWNSTVRLLTGVQRDAESLGDIGLLEARTRTVARLGRLIPERSLRRALDNEQRITTSINRAFDHADVLLTPLCAATAPLLDDCPSAGALRSLRAANTSAWLVPWNLTGQPAMSIPTGTADGLPTAVQLVGRPHDETTLLDLAAQIEAASPHSRWHAARLTPLP
jgi:amidase